MHSPPLHPRAALGLKSVGIKNKSALGSNPRDCRADRHRVAMPQLKP